MTDQPTGSRLMPETRTAVAPLLVARDADLSFGATRALTGASVEIGPGEIVALLGPSGSGKSTLLHCLAGILRPDAGEIVYRGQRVDDRSDEQRSALRRSDFGFVFQFGSLVSELSALENVALPLRLSGQRRRPAEATAREWLDRFDVGDLAGKRPGEMSGGQGQRVAVARALVTGPRVVFADEPTGALDSYSGERVMDLLSGVARAQGASIVLVTHEARVAAYADREVSLRDGAVVPEVVRA
ncbi:MAG: putative transport system ATP-binding protein [Actinomycetota bacterium]|jgi:putative ABC transport system ATP-binding protein|nr:putative transport system ATP-binding protein [Actinomycetota bacterium]